MDNSLKRFICLIVKGFEVETKKHMVCKVKRALRGLQQTFRQWFLRFLQVVTSFNFKENVMGQLYVSQSHWEYIHYSNTIC